MSSGIRFTTNTYPWGNYETSPVNEQAIGLAKSKHQLALDAISFFAGVSGDYALRLYVTEEEPPFPADGDLWVSDGSFFRYQAIYGADDRVNLFSQALSDYWGQGTIREVLTEYHLSDRNAVRFICYSTGEQMQAGVNFTPSQSGTYTVSFDVCSTTGSALKSFSLHLGEEELDFTLPSPDVAERVSITATLTEGATYQAYVTPGPGEEVLAGDVILLGGVLIEESAHAGIFFDGSSAGATWSGDHGASSSLYAPAWLVSQRLPDLFAIIEPGDYAVDGVVDIFIGGAPIIKEAGDLWDDDRGNLWRWDGTDWIALLDSRTPVMQDELNRQAREIADALEELIGLEGILDGIAHIFYQVHPPENPGVGDIWIDISSGRVLKRWDGDSWEVIDDERLDDLLNEVDSKITTYWQDAMPVGGNYAVGDLWFETDQNNRLHRWNGDEWVDITFEDPRIDEALFGTAMEYAVNNSETEPPTTGWSEETPVRVPGTFIWYRARLTYGDGHETVSAPALLTGNTGAPGDQGLPGPPGSDGSSLYTWLKYADTPTSGMSNSPEGKTYIGLAFNQVNPTETEHYEDYEWSLIKGEDGIPGEPGDDGVTLYTWVKYADDASGGGMSEAPAGKEYIGLAYNKDSQQESNDPADYTWSLIKGEDGHDGVDGVSIVSFDSFYALMTSTPPNPYPPSGMNPIFPWLYGVEPPYEPDTELWRTERVIFSNDTFSWTKPSKVASYEAAKAAMTVASGKVTLSQLPPTLADGENKPIGAMWYQIADVGVDLDAGNRPGGDEEDEEGTEVIVGGWRWSGIEWKPVSIVPGEGVYFPHVDLATGTVGMLSAGQIETAAIGAEHLSAVIALVGMICSAETGKRWEADEDGIRVYAQDDSLLINFPTDPNAPNLFQGDLIAQSLDVLGKLSIKGNDNEVYSGSSLALADGVSGPQTGPSMEHYYPTYATGARSTSGPHTRGFAASGSSYYRVRRYANRLHLDQMRGSDMRVQNEYEIDGYDRTAGIASVGNRLFAFLREGRLGSYWVQELSPSTGAKIGTRWSYASAGAVERARNRGGACIGSNSTQIIIAHISGDAPAGQRYIRWRIYNLSGTQVGAEVVTSVSINDENAYITGIKAGNFNGAPNNRVFISLGHENFVRCFNANGTEDPDNNFPTAYHQPIHGLEYGTAAFGSAARDDGRVHVYSNQSIPPLYAAVTWAQGIFASSPQSVASPTTYFVPRKRARVRTSLPPRPPAGLTNITHTGVFMGLTATRTRLQRQNATTAQSVHYESPNLPTGTATNPPPLSSTLTSGTPAEVRSEGGNVALRGDGSARLGVLDVLPSGGVALRGEELDFTWKTFTTTIYTSGSGLSMGNSVRTGRYCQIGKTVFINWFFQMGSTFQRGTGTWSFNLPVPPRLAINQVLAAQLATAGSGDLTAVAKIEPQNARIERVFGSVNAGATALNGHSASWNWSTGNTIQIGGSYEAA